MSRVRFTFARSGGLVAAPGLQVVGQVALEDDIGEVTADPDYRRQVGAGEGGRLVRDALRLVELGASASRHMPSPPAPDAYRYRFTIEVPSGGGIVIRATDADAGTGVPELARLVDWAAREAEEIVRHRFRS